MNKLILILLTAGLLGAQACKEVETPDPDPTPDTSIEGTWNFKGLDMKNGSYSTGGVTVATYESTSSNEVGTVTFGEDGQMTSNIGYTNTFTMTIFGQSQTETEDIPQESDVEPYTFNSSTNTLVIGQGEDMVAFQVSGLGTGNLVLSGDLEFSEELDGQMVTNSADLEMRLSR